MPNHMHGIIVIHPDNAKHNHTAPTVGAIHELPLRTNRLSRRVMLLPKIIGYFKMNAAKRINEKDGTSGTPVWQRNYYEHVVRNEHDLDEIRRYIADNPAQWALDEENPVREEAHV